MPEGTPIAVQIILAILAAIGAGKLLHTGYTHWLGKSKSDAETEGLRLSNTDKEIDSLERAMAFINRMQAEMASDKIIIAAFKDDKIEDDRKISRRDGVIDEQRKELRELHEQMAEIQAKHRALEVRVDALERENKELLMENLQLKGTEENAGKTADNRE